MMTISSTTAPLGAVDETAFRGSLAGVRGLLSAHSEELIPLNYFNTFDFINYVYCRNIKRISSRSNHPP